MPDQIDQQRRCSTPRPHPFVLGGGDDQDKRIALVGRGLDDVVASFVLMEERGIRGEARELWRFVVATRRLWILALRLYRARRRRG